MACALVRGVRPCASRCPPQPPPPPPPLPLVLLPLLVLVLLAAAGAQADVFVTGRMPNNKNAASWTATGGLRTLGSELADWPYSHAMATFRGEVYVGGDGRDPGPVARWTGTSWVDISKALPYYETVVYALTVFEDQLVAGGTAAVYRWDGALWRTTGAGFDNIVYALHVHGGFLYAGGSFKRNGVSLTVNGIARWDGVAWYPLGTGVNGTSYTGVYALATGPDGALYAGGTFFAAGGVSAPAVARWDGATWSAAGNGTGGTVYALATFQGRLYAGGRITPDDLLAYTPGAQTWTAVGDADGYINVLAADSGFLYIGGSFTRIHNVNCTSLMLWDGTVFAPMQSVSNYVAGMTLAATYSPTATPRPSATPTASPSPTRACPALPLLPRVPEP